MQSCPWPRRSQILNLRLSLFDSLRPGQRPARQRLLVLFTCLLALGGRAPAKQAPAALRRKVLALIGPYEKKSHAIACVSVVDLRTGRPILAIRDDRLQIPASNQKLLTGAFALVRLGGGFRFETTVYLLPSGDICIAGSHDPTLGDPSLAKAAGVSIYAELDRWAGAIKSKVGRTVRGDILLRCRRPGSDYRHEDWPVSQRQRWYAAPVCELNFHNNCFDVRFAVVSGRVRPDVQPQSRMIRVLSKVKRGSSGLWSLRANDDDSELTLRGNVKGPTRVPYSVAANHPPLLLGRVLIDRLERTGVKLQGRLRQVRPQDVDLSAAELLCRTTTPLSDVLTRANKRSLNMAAESIFLQAGDGTWDGSAGLMEAALTRSFALRPGSLKVRDGSGLSGANRVSAGAMTKVLLGAGRRGDAKLLISSLPSAGVDGTLKKRLRQNPYRGRVRAKTGYIRGASCLSGYVLDKTGAAAVAFSVLVNRVPSGKAWQAKQLQDAIVRLLVDSLR